MSMYRYSRVFCLIATFYLWQSIALATTFEIQSLESLTKLSTHVVRGSVAKVESRLAADRSSVYTRIVIKEIDSFSENNKSDELVVYLPGGSIGELQNIVLGAPILSVKDDLILMLRAVPESVEGATSEGLPAFNVVGLSQGVFNVVRLEDEKELFVRSQLLLHMDEGAVEEGGLAPPGGTRGIPIKEFRDRVVQIIKNPDKPDIVEPDGEEILKQADPKDELGNPDDKDTEEGSAEKTKEEGISGDEDKIEEGTGDDSGEDSNSIEKPQQESTNDRSLEEK